MVSSSSFLFVGLGNPGLKYEMTRHNIGYLVLRSFIKKHGGSFKNDLRFRAETAKLEIEGQTIHLLLPSTYMNLSGEAVAGYMNYFKIPCESLLIVVDDIALPFGKLRLRGWGSSGGHNGLKSVERTLQSNQYKRLRMGIGHPGEKILADFVLESFSSQEQIELEHFIDKGIAVLQNIVAHGFSATQNAMNRLTQPKTLGLGE